MSVTGNTLELQVKDPRTGQGISGLTCTLYVYGMYVTGSDYTVIGTAVSGLTGTSVTVSGTTGRWGLVSLEDVPPGVFTVIASGQGYPTQVVEGFERYEVSQLIRGNPDYLQLHDATGGTWYVSMSTGGTLVITTGIT